MPILAWIAEIFPVPQEPYTMPEIVLRLQQLYSPHISKSSIYRALDALELSTATAALVVPVDAEAWPRLYSAESARRIARKACGSRSPDWFNDRAERRQKSFETESTPE